MTTPRPPDTSPGVRIPRTRARRGGFAIGRTVALLLFSGVISRVGDYALAVALPFWVYELTGSATGPALVFIALTVPALVVSPLAGVLVDRSDRKQVMIAADLIRVAIVGLLLLVQDARGVWFITVLAFAESSIAQFFQPARAALVPAVVPQERLGEVNGMFATGIAIATVIGPVVGGLLFATVGPHGAVVFDAASFAFSAMAVFAIAAPRQTVAARVAQGWSVAVGRVLADLREGFESVVRGSVLRALFAMAAIFSLSQGIFGVLTVVAVARIWHAGPVELGWIRSTQGVGAIVGGVIVSVVARRINPRTLLVAGAAVPGVCILGAVNQSSIAVAAWLLALGSGASMALQVGLPTMVQLRTVDASRGRVFALLTSVLAAATLISAALAAPLAAALGVGRVFDIAAGCFLAAAIFAFVALPATLRTDPQPELLGQTAAL